LLDKHFGGSLAYVVSVCLFCFRKALAFSFKEDEKGDSLSMTHSAVRGAFAAIHIRLPPQTLNQWLVDVDEDSSDSIELNEVSSNHQSAPI
jgi:hypothetical protein